MRTLSFLHDIELRDSASFGEEASALGDLASAGAPVSPGFVLPVSTYAEFLASRKVKEAFAAGSPQDSQKLRSLLAGVALPSRLASEVEEFYRSLSGPRDIRVSVRAEGRDEEADSAPAVVSAVKRIWIDHLAGVYDRGGNPFQEPLPILVQQVSQADLSGTIFTSAADLGSTDFCTIEVYHSNGKERMVFEKGTDELVKRTVSGMVDRPAGETDLKDLIDWAVKIEQILGGPFGLEWNRYRGELVFGRAKRVFLPLARTSSLEVWIEVHPGSVPDSKEFSGLVCRDAEWALSLAKSYPDREVLLVLEAGEFEQLDKFRDGKHKTGLKNLHLVLPPVRTVDGVREIKRYLSGERIQRGPHLKFFFRLYYPANLVLLEEFLETGLDGVILDEEALARGFLGTKESVEPDETIIWAIREASRKCRSAGAELFYLGRRARSFVLFELVRSHVQGLIFPQEYQAEHVRALQEAEVERLS